MKLNPMDMGVCGVEQVLYAGSVAFDTKDIATGAVIGKLPANTIITGAVAVVKTAFNAATTNVLTLGSGNADDNLMGTADITEGTTGAYVKNVWVDCSVATDIKAKFTQSGTAATAGAADIFLKVVRRPE